MCFVVYVLVVVLNTENYLFVYCKHQCVVFKVNDVSKITLINIGSSF